MFKKPWVDDDDEGSEDVPASALLPGKKLGVHRQALIRMARAELSAGLAVSSDAQIEHNNGTLVNSSNTITSSWRNVISAKGLLCLLMFYILLMLPISRPATAPFRQGHWWC